MRLLMNLLGWFLAFFAAEPVFNVELLLLKLSMLFLMMVLTTTVMIMTTF